VVAITTCALVAAFVVSIFKTEPNSNVAAKDRDMILFLTTLSPNYSLLEVGVTALFCPIFSGLCTTPAFSLTPVLFKGILEKFIQFCSNTLYLDK
jgi:hypothetical protein